MSKIPGGWALPGLIGLALVAGLVLLLVRLFGGTPEIPTSPPADTAAESEVRAGEPDTLPPGGLSGLGRQPVVVYRTVTKTLPDTKLVRRLGDLQRRHDRWRRERDSLLRLAPTAADSETVSRETPEPPAILPPARMRYDGRWMTVWAPLSSGRLVRAEAKARAPVTVTMGHGGTTDTLPLIVGERWWLAQVKEAARCSPYAAVAALGGALLVKKNRPLGALGAGGLVLGGCLAD